MDIDKKNFIENIERLREYSIQIKELSDNNDALVDYLNNLPSDVKQKNFEQYQNGNGPILTIRKEISQIVKDRTISKAEIEAIINAEKDKAPDKFKMYPSWYSILYILILADADYKMNIPVHNIINITIDSLGANGKIVAKDFDFRGARNTGSTRCWIAFINQTHKSQTTAKQLFLDIYDGNVEFCFYNRPLDEKKDKNIVKRGIPFDVDTYFSIFNQYLPEILKDEWIEKASYWRIGTKDGDTSYWEEMKSEKKICIGWPEIGDLKSAGVKSKNDIISLLDENGYYNSESQVRSRKGGEIFNFYSKINIGDIVLVQDGYSVLGIAQVEDDYQYNTDADFPHQKTVKWLSIQPELSNKIGKMTAVYQITDKDKIKEIEDVISLGKNGPEIELTQNIDTNMKINYLSNPLNQILYGPPGTGKTYHTINKAISIIDGLTEEELESRFSKRDKLKERFNGLLIDDWTNPQGQIAFVTFHQSMCYEDFIEGIKPYTNNEKQVAYDVEAGIFKKLAEVARNNWSEAHTPVNDTISFNDAFEMLQEEWENNHQLLFPLKQKGKDYTILNFTSNSIHFKKASGGTSHTLNISTLKDYFYGTRPIQSEGLGKYYQSLLNKLKSYQLDESSDQPTKGANKKVKPYILIIDEINRGNVSQIFGELITLIEEDKRLGKEEVLETILPYSKDRFGVPPNLYIIGTMNTADRSVEALDTALRRRFCFQEIPPKPELLENTIQIDEEEFSLKDILKKINERIELLLDKDHLIGHSYFMKVDSLEKLQAVFHQNILPLLQEYFFGDHGKIGLIVGKGFIESIKSPSNISKIFADFDYDNDVSSFTNRAICKIKDCSATKMGKDEFKKAILQLLNK